MLSVAVALLPVTAFLLALLLIDSFKLVTPGSLARALALGAAAALVALPLHAWLFPVTGLGAPAFSRLVAPLTEETLKAFVLIYPLRRRQVGFLVDAAILGFAVGTGFAVVENLDYLRAVEDHHIWVWIVRGFGTAILHATTTAVIAIAAKASVDENPRHGLVGLLTGWIIAVVLHSMFNYALVSPVLAAAMLMVGLPLAVLAVFSRSERMTREWVSSGLDLDVELLRLIQSAHFGGTPLGRYLQELRARFPGPIVADIFCLVQLDLELGIRAKGMLMAREAGLEVPVDDALRAQLAERTYLEKEIGTTGLLALRPLHMSSHRDAWHHFLLEQAGEPTRWWSRRSG